MYQIIYKDNLTYIFIILTFHLLSKQIFTIQIELKLVF